MDKVDEALEWADQVADNAPGATHEAILAAEVRRLRAMLEPTPDARELESLLCKVNRVTAYHRHGQAIPKSALDDLANAQIDSERWIAAHDARLLDDAVERAIAWWRKGHPYNYKAHEAELRAAIKGAAHE